MARSRRWPRTRGAVRAAAGAAAGLTVAAGLAFYAFAIEPRRVQVVRYRVGVPALPPALGGIRIAHLTDFHIGSRPTHRGTLYRAVGAAVSARPDLIALTGDFVDDGVWEPVPGLFARLAAVAPTLAVLGNHDRDAGERATAGVIRNLEREGVRVLRNEHLTVQIRNAELLVVAVDDPYRDYDDLAAAMGGIATTADPARPALLLAHVPDIVERAPVGRFALALAGHTHGGQVRLSPLKRFTPLEVSMIAGGLDSRYPRGTRVLRGNPLFVSNGLGLSSLPMRFLAPPQIAVFTLEPGVDEKRDADDPERFFTVLKD